MHNMSLKELLKEDMKTAMKAREEGKVALSVIRMVNSAIKNAEINNHKELDDTEVLSILVKEVKLRQDSLTGFEQGGRTDLVEQTKAEMAVLAKYLPKQLSADEIRDIVKVALSQCTVPYKMGEVMAKVMPSTKGKADGKLVNTIVKEEMEKA